MVSSPKLGWADYLVVVAMMAISIGIGIYYRFTGGKQKTTKEYFNANRSMSPLPVGIALMVSFMSAITILGLSSEIYVYGTQFVTINLSYFIGTPIICYGFLPVFYKLQATSAYEYLEKRFGVGVRLTASFVSWIQMLLYSGVVLFAPALALEATTGMPKIWSIVAVGVICTLYSCVGGIKAVLVTDVFQAILMFASIFVVIGMAAYEIGGFSEIWRIAQERQRIEFDNISIDPTVRHTWWSLLFGGLCTFVSLFGVSQIQVQRMMTVRSLKSARTAMWLNWPILSFLSFTTSFSGLAIYSHYYKCDPIESQGISIDMLMPLYVMERLSHLPGVPGLFVAGIFSASLSTISAALNSLSALSIEDYIKPLYSKCCKNQMSDRTTVLLGKLLSLFFGALSIGLAFAAESLGGVLQASLTIFGVVGGPLLGLFTLGMLTKSARQPGAIIGVFTSLIFLFWISFGYPRPKPAELPRSVESCDIIPESFHANSTSVLPHDSDYFYLYRISYMWYSPIGFLITFIVGFVVSNVCRILFKEESKELNPDLFFPVIAKGIRRRNPNHSSVSNSMYVFKNKQEASNGDGSFTHL